MCPTAAPAEVATSIHDSLQDAFLNAQKKAPPVSVAHAAADSSMMQRMHMAQHNLLRVWRERDYSVRTSKMTLLNQNYILCNSPDTVRHVFLAEHANYDRKSPHMRQALTPLLGDGLFVSDGDLWRTRRKQCAPALHNGLLPEFTKVMTASAEETARQWHQKAADQPVDMLKEMAHLTARIIGRTIFGDDTTDKEAEQVVAGFSEYQQHAEQLDLANMLGLPFLKLFGNPRRRARTRYSAQQVHEVIDRIIDRHMNTQGAESGRFSLIESFIEQMGDPAKGGCPHARNAVRNEAIVMFMAGHETTANSLAWCWYLLDYDRDAMAKLQHELDSVLQVRTPTFDDIDQLPYTRAVFEESMRLYPPVPLLSRQAREEDQIRNRKVTRNSVILAVPWLLHRHRKLWEAPDHFIPERFMPGAPRPDKFAYLPFSVGPRVCLGKRFGLYEGILCLATLAQQFTPHCLPDHKTEIECRLTLRPEGGLPMTLNPR
ncbi:cytochrome P450 [Halomonas sp. LS-001]